MKIKKILRQSVLIHKEKNTDCGSSPTFPQTYKLVNYRNISKGISLETSVEYFCEEDRYMMPDPRVTSQIFTCDTSGPWDIASIQCLKRETIKPLDHSL